MNNKEIFYPESKFGGFTDVDGTVAFWRGTFFGACLLHAINY